MADDDAQETESAASSPEEASIAADDFIRLAYTMRTSEDGRVVDTTDVEVAEEAEIDVEEFDIEPRVIIVDGGYVFEAVEQELIGAAPGATGELTIAAEDAFGAYDEGQVRTVSASKVDDDDRYPGAQVQIDGQQGRIITIIGGRARIDFNHPLAGEDLEYTYEVLERVDDPVEQAESMLSLYLQSVPEMWIATDTVTEAGGEDEDEETEVEKESLYIEATPQMTLNQQWLFSKHQIADDIISRIGVDRIVVQEVIEGYADLMGDLSDIDMEGAAEVEEMAAELDESAPEPE
ncbi:MAG: peptidylprolyl isomerase [Haloquadratum sp.]|jgi:FKBP-type peptidyl-prolyl cis-trans isomerase SlyD|nr:peptidylprolyl isomerase [Haloferacaceae archaeon]MDR9445045.1 peptidylprolyl isomerase [Haloquadratum sp.]